MTGGTALLLGYCWAAVRRIERPVSPELIRFHRREQMARLKGIFLSLLKFNKVDNFNTGASLPVSRDGAVRVPVRPVKGDKEAPRPAQSRP